MNLKSKSRGLMLSLFLFTVLSNGLFAQTPERIMLNPAEDGTKGVSITWRTTLEIEKSSVQYGLAQTGPLSDLAAFRVVDSQTHLDSVTYKEVTKVFRSHRVRIQDLEAGKKYLYRVGSEGSGWSEWLQIDMPSGNPNAPFTFTYFGDPQNDIFSQWSRVVRQAYKTAPNTEFMLYAGDLVNRGYNDEEWDEWYRAGDFIHRTVPSIMTPGNHEYTNVVLSPLWNSLFTLPQNGPSGVKELVGACYYIDYPAVRIVSIDGEQIDEDPELRLAQLRWLENVLEKNDKKWTILTLHYPFFSTKPNRDNPKLRKAFKPVLDKYKVDLVLQGHDHAYGRGMVDATGPAESGTMYVVSVSGPKMYDLGDQEWLDKKAANTQLYQVITIEGERLCYKAYTATGEPFDSFVLKKSEQGNILLDE
ncbi:metallophosphoesterase family protein [Marinilongibacter aquaticus]|uniref:purple acid phosphatase family protein n=1 Tax=Marinilongibacter aquaticus TaxID=2975157 RepID=UPI0021BD3CE4|nr:metallophosphoesterase family protein [Marinilongibacter aquaticus]UBM57178.1 metallophosphoesterase family protein [Marinilongibacter aquaticus]